MGIPSRAAVRALLVQKPASTEAILIGNAPDGCAEPASSIAATQRAIDSADLRLPPGMVGKVDIVVRDKTVLDHRCQSLRHQREQLFIQPWWFDARRVRLKGHRVARE